MAPNSDNSDGVPDDLKQIQFQFENIPPLTDEERVAIWLSQLDETEETEDTVVANLYISDSRSRRRRAKRWLQIQAVKASLYRKGGWLMPGGMEASWLYDESCYSYVDGAYLAALLCAHASCERTLAGCLVSYEERLPKGWSMWGLGKLIPKAYELGLIDEPLRDQLHRLGDLRKVSAHFKPPLEPNSVTSRALREVVTDRDVENEDEYDALLRTDALMAIKITTELLLGDQGFARVRYWGYRS
jgi:hypothetical protein